MKNMNSTEIVKEQYQTADKLNIRIALHQEYSTNKIPFGDWIVSNYQIKPGCRILELGCGTGDMWKEHLSLVRDVEQLVLSDFSKGMLETTKVTLEKCLLNEPSIREKVDFQTIDIQDIPYEDNSFDIVIANMMLYHVPNLQKGLSEVTRVLKKDGVFYCATYGEHGIIQYIEALLEDYDVKGNLNTSFTLQNGAELLQPYFENVKKLEREDGLVITEIEDMIDYIYSCTSMTNVTKVDRDILRELLQAKMRDGILYVPKEYGMFIGWKM